MKSRFAKLAFLIPIAFLVRLPNSHALEYYEAMGGGRVMKIDSSRFMSCPRILFRDVGREALPLIYKKRLLAATLKGETIHDTAAIKALLIQSENVCTYSVEGEDLSN